MMLIISIILSAPLAIPMLIYRFNGSCAEKARCAAAKKHAGNRSVTCEISLVA